MKRFMETNTVTYNLMSFSGFKAILLFTYLLEGPKTYDDMQKYLLDNRYLNESVSIDTIRIYINSLKKIGCDVKVTSKKRVRYYSIASHPFELKITEQQAQSILNVFKAISSSIAFEDYMSLQHFFEKIAPYISNEDLKQQIRSISPLKGIANKLLKDITKYVKNKSEITVLYNSPNSGHKEIDILSDKLFITNGKLYLSGYNSEHKNYGSLHVNNIIKIISVNSNTSKLNIEPLIVQYKFALDGESKFSLIEDETIIDEDKEFITVEIKSKNKFFITQRILSHASKCTVISPIEYKQEIVSYLKKMKEGYFG